MEWRHAIGGKYDSHNSKYLRGDGYGSEWLYGYGQYRDHTKCDPTFSGDHTTSYDSAELYDDEHRIDSDGRWHICLERRYAIGGNYDSYYSEYLRGDGYSGERLYGYG